MQVFRGEFIGVFIVKIKSQLLIRSKNNVFFIEKIIDTERITNPLFFRLPKLETVTNKKAQ